MKGIVIVELKGFSEIAPPLLYRMEKIELKDTQIKLKYRNTINSIISQSGKQFNANQIMAIGGDTWVIEYDNIETAIKSAALVVQMAYNEVIKTGLYYVKPVVSVGRANPVFEGDRFIDRETTDIYRVADAGEPFALYMIQPGLDQPYLMDVSFNKKLEALKEIDFKELDWKNFTFSDDNKQLQSSFYLSSLLSENDIAFFKTNEKSFEKFVELQNEAKVIYAFGGAIRFKIDSYDNYAKSIFKLFRTKDCKCYVLSYIDSENNKVNNYYWLRLCQSFIREYDRKFIFSFYEADTSQVKPLAYHIYDDQFIQMVLRNYNPSENESIMSSSILIRNKLLGEKFINEFLENFRKLKNQTTISLETYLSKIDLSPEIKQNIDNHISILSQA